jgi:ATP/maltotriose-dependent transcriptional regulator MalT
LSRTMPKVFVTRFFQLISARQFAEAERVLERIKQKITMSERNRGYYQALYGMLLAQRSNDDRYAFLTNLSTSTKKELHESRREFLRQSEHRLHADYDRGFFSAWADYMRLLSKMEAAAVPMANNKVSEEKSVEPVEQPEASEKPDVLETSPEAKPEQSTLADFSE